MSSEEFIVLAAKVAEGEASPAELAFYNAAYDSFQDDSNSLPVNIDELEKVSLHTLRENIGIPPEKLKLWPRYVGVAAAVTAIAFGVWFFNAPRHSETARGPQYTNDVGPGKNTATLSVNGRSVQLSDAKNGVRIDRDQLVYNDGTSVISKEAKKENLSGVGLKMTAATPRGGTYSFVLEDGTKVWLNADSKLEFLSDYSNKNQRIVKLEGEGYFEVAKDKTRPFIVESAGQKVEVLGTHFNINAYKEEGATKTTLLEGSVRINDIVLKPNQQAIVSGQSGIKVKAVDANSSIDWKNGEFVCINEPLSAIMRKMERWYNIEVIYTTDDLKNRTFDGSFSRYDNVSRILKTIEFAGTVKFKLEGRKVFVTK